MASHTTYGLKYVGRTVDTDGSSNGSTKPTRHRKPRKKSQPALGLPRPKFIYRLGYCRAVRINVLRMAIGIDRTARLPMVRRQTDDGHVGE